MADEIGILRTDVEIESPLREGDLDRACSPLGVDALRILVYAIPCATLGSRHAESRPLHVPGRRRGLRR